MKGKPLFRGRQAVALRYQVEKDRAPKVTAKGRGFVADKILEVAKQNNIPVREDKNLVQMLTALEIDQEIPANVYKAVAEILAFVYKLSKR